MTANRFSHSAGHGNSHWYWQRVSGIALAILTLWFAVFVIRVATVEHEAYAELVYQLGNVHNAAMMILFILSVAFHASLGMQVIIEDYLHKPLYHHSCMIVQRLFCIYLATVGTVSVFKIMSASSAALLGAH